MPEQQVFEFRGVDNLYFARILQDDAAGFCVTRRSASLPLQKSQSRQTAAMRLTTTTTSL